MVKETTFRSEVSALREVDKIRQSKQHWWQFWKYKEVTIEHRIVWVVIAKK